MVSLDDWLKNYLDGKQIPEECERELIVTMTERTDNYCQVAIYSETPDWKFEKFFGNSNMDAYFTMLFNGYILGRLRKCYVAIDSNVWGRLKMARKVLLKGQLRNLAIIDIISMKGL